MNLTRSALVLAVFLLSGCTATAVAAPVVTSPRAHEMRPIRVAAVGDSHTAGVLTGQKSVALNPTNPEPTSWLHYVLNECDVWAGGWAVGGASVEDMIGGVTAPIDADVLVIMAGWNNLGGENSSGVSFQPILDSIDRIAATAGVRKVILSAVPPYVYDPARGVAYNAALKVHAAEQGWNWVDPWATIRTSDTGEYLPGMTIDTYHTTPQGASIGGAVIGREIASVERRDYQTTGCR